MKDLADFVKIPSFFSPENAVITKISFLSTVNDTAFRLEQSISSIEAIAEEIGRDYEIILCIKPGSVRSSLVAFDIRGKYENVSIIRSTGNVGEDYSNLINKSTGNYIIIFESSTIYDLQLADTISVFLANNEKKAVFTSMLIIPRSLVNEIGGWKNLRQCSEIDVLGRISLNFGILVFPVLKTIIPPSYLFSGNNIVNSVYYSKVAEIIPTLTNILSFRDCIIGCNFTYRDILLRIKLEKFPRKVLLGITLFAASILRTAKKSGNSVSSQNRYVQFVESMIESIIFKEYERYKLSGEETRIYINAGDMEYLKRKSELWSKVNFRDYLVEMEMKNREIKRPLK